MDFLAAGRPERHPKRSQSVFIEQTRTARGHHVFRPGCAVLAGPKKIVAEPVLRESGLRVPASTPAFAAGPSLRTPHAHAVYRRESERREGMRCRGGLFLREAFRPVGTGNARACVSIELGSGDVCRPAGA